MQTGHETLLEELMFKDDLQEWGMSQQNLENTFLVAGRRRKDRKQNYLYLKSSKVTLYELSIASDESHRR